ncbi:MAG: ROK family protein [Chloracidobacterium sp.]|nr:ROK family protein [Chloracidobacterium sp.]
MTNEVVLAVDLGGTNLRMATVGHDGRIFSHAKTETEKANNPITLLTALSELADECRASLTSDQQIVGIGVGVPANITPDGVLQNLPNLPSLEGMNLKADLSAKFNFPVVLENDATAAAIGENWLGASKDVRDSIMITLGTGVGGGIIIDNKSLRGIDGTAGKIGHICVEPDGHPCGCGSNGCIEQYASATAIVRLATEAGLDVSTSLDVYELATGSDIPHSELRIPHSAETAQAVFNKMGRYLGITLGGLVNTLNPEMIVIGGGAAAAWDAFIDPLTAELHYRAFNEPADRVQIVQGTLGDNAGILGVARLGFSKTEKT